ncbi:MAG: methyltransferase domain-containing protein [Treponema sp.]|nr:methyltransferase domain-containing protein [Treponema sp.]
MIAVIVQCRLSSTRLPRKALKDLGGIPVLAWTLRAMRKIPADAYYVATDTESFNELEVVAKSCGWECFEGPKDDVLARYCMLIEKINADIVVRATADNPFLFYEAAQSLLEEYKSLDEYTSCDYMTWTGLPHGSGVEVFNAHSLLKARTLTENPYDHEHVGPALYNHTDTFDCRFVEAPARWKFPHYRTTIDTSADYIRAQTIIHTVSDGQAGTIPYTTEQIVSAFDNPSVSHMILCVPSTMKGRGTGHLRRCLDLVLATGAAIYIPSNADLNEIDQLVDEYIAKGMHPWQVTSSFPLPGDYSLIFTDMFSLDAEMAESLYMTAPVAALDEGSVNTGCCDFLLNVIPSLKKNQISNLVEPYFMDMPTHRKERNQITKADDFKNILISIGGEDPAGLALPAAIAFAKLGKNVTVIHSLVSALQKKIPKQLSNRIKVLSPVPELRESLCEYDLVVTHYGLTAYEASAAGCAVLLLATTDLHEQLASKYGFAYISGDKKITNTTIKAVLNKPKRLYIDALQYDDKPHIELSDFVRRLSYGRRLDCPICHRKENWYDMVEARTAKRTFRRCQSCGMVYMSWTLDDKDTDYSKTYFFDEYKNQYGKTYLEDFTTIKAQCVRRTSMIDLLYHHKLRSVTTPTILDIGCAFGPFLAAATDAGWQAFGTDVSEEAISYVRTKLLFPAACAAFPHFDAMKEFGIRVFDAVTMWYVIEHFRDLDAVLKAVSSIVKNGGIFAFSTPSLQGVSGRFNRDSFFAQSPADHYTLWEPTHVQAIVARYGFKVVKIVSTGHHPERFPLVKKYGWHKKSLPYILTSAASHTMQLGDTFEVYCKKMIR